MPPPKTSAEDAPLRGQRPLASLVRPPISQNVGAAYAAASGGLLGFTLWVKRARMGLGPKSVVSAGSLARRAEFGPTIQDYIQWTLRSQLRETDQTLPNMNDQPTQQPTTESAFRLFAHVAVVLVVDGDIVVRRIIHGVTNHVREVLALLNMPVEVLTRPRKKQVWASP